MARLWSIAALTVALAGATLPAYASVIYDFAFTDVLQPGQIDGTGNFVTQGPGSSPDAGYELLSALTVTSLRDNATNTLDVGSLAAMLVAGSAYDPTTGMFLNHVNGNTYGDLGLIILTGSLSPNSVQSSGSLLPYITPLAFARSNADFARPFEVANGDNSKFTSYPDYLVVTPQAPTGVPEPASAGLLATGLIGLTALRRRRRS